MTAEVIPITLPVQTYHHLEHVHTSLNSKAEKLNKHTNIRTLTPLVYHRHSN